MTDGDRWSKARERIMRFWTKHRTQLLIIGIGLALLVLLFTITKAYLAVRLLVGNDLVLELQGPPGSAHAYHGDRIALPYGVAITANPFCEASCVAILRDLGHDTVLDAQEFSIRTGSPYAVEQTVTMPEIGEGQAAYRYEVTCTAAPDILCHTSGVPVSRSLTTMITYAPRAQERERLETARARLLNSSAGIAQERARLSAIWADIAALNRTIDTDVVRELADVADRRITSAESANERVGTLWNAQDTGGLEIAADESATLLAESAVAVEAARVAVDEQLTRYHAGFAVLWRAHETIANAISRPVPDAWRRAQLTESIEAYRSAQAILANLSDDTARDSAIGRLEREIIAPMGGATFSDSTSALVVDLFADTILDALCAQTGTCVPHATIGDRSGATNRTVQDACARLDALHATLTPSNATFMQQAYQNGTLGNTTLEWIAKERANDAWRSAVESAVLALNTSDQRERTALLALSSGPSGPTDAISSTDKNLTPLVGMALTRLLPSCEPANLTTPHLPPIAIGPIPLSTPPQPIQRLELPDVPPMCCTLGECRTCCDDGQCKASIVAPIIFLHGHAFNRDTSAAYSLDAFEVLQRRLEEDGYLSVGTLDLSDTSVPDGEWTRGGSAVSVKASYYYDVYAGPDNAGLVQTKTENIDTYAIRLRDIIDETRRRTGQDRVTLVAHSMGGLVVRRYLQIFGDAQVARVIMIGTPNAGISGQTAEYCTFLGENLECRDMKEGSLFLNKLERAPIPSSPVSVIIGSGCDMRGEDGDGVVTVRSATLPWAHDRTLNGTCSGIGTLHTTMLDADAYPAIYELLLDELRR